MQNPSEQNLIDVIRGLRDAERVEEAVQMLDRYLRTATAAQKQTMVLREMAPHLNVDAFDTVFRACVDTNLTPPRQFVHRHFKALFSEQSMSAAPRLEEYLHTTGNDNAQKELIIGLYIDAAVATKNFAAALDCFQAHPSLFAEAHVVAVSRAAAQHKHHRTVETLARLVQTTSLSRKTQEAVMLDRIRVYKQLGQLNDVVETLWTDIFAVMQPSKEFVLEACSLWEGDNNAVRSSPVHE